MESTVIVKAMGLLEATANAEEGRSLAELAQEVGLTKPTAHRILKILTTMGYIERLEGGIYRQTGRLRLLLAGGQDRALMDAADFILRDLHLETQETVNLGVLRNGRILYLTVLESPHPLRRVAHANARDPVHCTALGRAILAFLPRERRLYHLSGKLLRSTPYTVTDVDELMAILDTAQKNGYAIERDQTDVGVTCIAAPVFDDQGVIAAISVSLPTARAADGREQQLVEAVRRAAEQLTGELRQQALAPTGEPTR